MTSHPHPPPCAKHARGSRPRFAETMRDRPSPSLLALELRCRPAASVRVVAGQPARARVSGDQASRGRK